MTQATRCPACGTVFRVVPDQLRVSAGWVRCGRCGDVFDASKALFELDAPGLPPPPPGTAGPSADAAALQAEPPLAAANDEPPAATAHMRSTLPPLSAADGAAEPVVSATPFPAAAGAAAAPGSASAAPTPSAAAPVPSAAAPAASAALPVPSAAAPAASAALPVPSAAAPVPSAAAPSPEAGGNAAGTTAPEAPATEPAQPLPGFLLRAQRAEARRRRPWPDALLAAALLLLLGGQIALHYRDLFAAAWPATRAPLAAACGVLGCELRAPLRIEGFTVESVVLRRVDESPMHLLQVVVRNRAGTAARLPTIDLALTDLEGRTTARRMIDARDLGATGDQLPAQGEVALQALLDLGDTRVAGYTVELFYP
jgi:predicted Zn finger-like uncharacterized protein